jgi:predicted DNA-binding protein with PD1-like motif
MSAYTIRRTLIGQLAKGTDLYNGITRIVRDNNVRIGRVTGMGAVQRASLAYYDQKQMRYSDIDIPVAMEIVSLYGNITLKDGLPFCHVHVVLSDEQGNGKGGHLRPGGTPVFACELTIEEYDGPGLARNTDESTGLSLLSPDATL